MAFDSGRRHQLAPRRSSQHQSGSATDLQRSHPGYEALADALLFGSDVAAVSAEIGSAMARDGASLHEAMDALRDTYAMCTGQEPAYAASRALALAWSEASLQYLHALSCEDPLTGLASLAHVRSRLTEIYREAERRGDNVVTTYALVVVELIQHARGGGAAHRLDRVLELTAAAECLRAVFSGGETLGRLGRQRAVAVVPRAAAVGGLVPTLRSLLADWGGQAGGDGLTSRVWIEQLPINNEAAGRLLDELAR